MDDYQRATNEHRSRNVDAYNYTSTTQSGGRPIRPAMDLYNRQQQQQQQQQHAPSSSATLSSVTSQNINPAATSQYSNTQMTSQNINPAGTLQYNNTQVTSQNINSAASQYSNTQMTSQNINPAGALHCINPQVTSQNINPVATSQYINPQVMSRFIRPNPPATSQRITPPEMLQYNNPPVTSQYINPQMMSRCTNPPATSQRFTPPVMSQYNNQAVTSQYSQINSSNSSALLSSNNNDTGLAFQSPPTSAADGLIIQPQDGLDSFTSDGTVPVSGENADDDADDDDDEEDQEELAPNATEKEKRAFARRTVFTRPQLRAMEERFVRQSFLTREERIDFGEELKLTERQIMIWFQNRRGRYKKRGPADKAYQHKQANDLKWTWNLNRPSGTHNLPNIQSRLSVNPGAEVPKKTSQHLSVQQPLSSIYNSSIQHRATTELSHQPELSLHQRLNYRVTERGNMLNHEEHSIAPNNAFHHNDARCNGNNAIIPDVVNTALNSMKSDYCSRLPPCRRQQEASFQITTQQMHSSKNNIQRGALTQAPTEQKLFTQQSPNIEGFYSQNLADLEYSSSHHATRQGFYSQNLDKYRNGLGNTVQQNSMLLNHTQHGYFSPTTANQELLSTNPEQWGLYSQNHTKGGYLSPVPTQQGFFTYDQGQPERYTQNSAQPELYSTIPLCCDSDSSNNSYCYATRNNYDVFELGVSYNYPRAQANNLPIQQRTMQSHEMGRMYDVRSYGEMKNKVLPSMMNIRGQYMEGVELQNAEKDIINKLTHR